MIFLYRFDKNGNGIEFILNEVLAEDMIPYPEYDIMLKPLVHSTCQILMPYKAFCKDDTIMTGTILDTNEFEVMLSTGLGKHIDAYTKNQIIFENARLIAEVLAKIMERRSLERRND